MKKDRSPMDRGRTLLAAAALVAGGLFVGSAEAAPLAPPPADAIAAESGIVSVRHGWGHHHHHWGHRGLHRGWHRHHHHHWGWGHRRHHHHHHHRGWRHRW